MTFSRTERGRPICPDPDWDINVSHQGNFTVLAAEKATSDQGKQKEKATFTQSKLREHPQMMSQMFFYVGF